MEDKLLFITTFYKPDIEIAANRLENILKLLYFKKFESFVITRDNNNVFSEKNINENGIIVYRISNSVKNIVKLLITKLKINKQKIINIKKENGEEQNKTKFFIRNLKGLIKVVNLMYWSNKAYRNAKEIINKNNIIKVIVTVPEIDSLIVGYLLKRRYSNLEIIEEIRDIISDNEIYKKSNSEFETYIYKKIEKVAIKKVNKFIYLTPKIKEHYEEKFNLLNTEKSKVIMNGYDRELFNRKLYVRTNILTITYIGQFYGSRNPINLIKAVNMLIINTNFHNIKVKLIGKFIDRDVKGHCFHLINENKLNEIIKIIDPISNKLAIEEILKSDVNILITHLNNESSYAIPGKLFEYIGAGRPILALTNDSLVIDIIKNDKLGYIADPSEINSIYNQLLNIYHNWSENKLTEISLIEKYDREIQVNELVNLIKI